MIIAFWHCALFVFFYMNFLFIISLLRKNNNIADVCWGIGFIIITLYTLFFYSNLGQRSVIASLLVLLWGTRLATYMWLRNKSRSEDWRYKQWRALWGKTFFLRSYLQIYMFQGVIMLLIATPIIIINSSSYNSELNFLDLFGFSVWLVGLFFESIADYQLYTFMQDPAKRGQIMMHGLWRYSRHPNYFGEVLIWWGLFLICCNVPYGWLAMVSPLSISYILLCVSGVPMTEKQLADLNEFAEYQKKTSIFIPWFVKK